MTPRHVVAGCSPQPDGTDRPSPALLEGLRPFERVLGSWEARLWGEGNGTGVFQRVREAEGALVSLQATLHPPGRTAVTGLRALFRRSCLKSLPLVGFAPPSGCCCSEQRAPSARPLPARLSSHSKGPAPPGSSEHHPALPPLTRLRTTGLTHLRVNGDEEVFDLWAGTTSHLQEHVPRLPGALPDRGAQHENAVSALSSAPQSPLQLKAGVSQAPRPQQMFHFLY